MNYKRASELTRRAHITLIAVALLLAAFAMWKAPGLANDPTFAERMEPKDLRCGFAQIPVDCISNDKIDDFRKKPK